MTSRRLHHAGLSPCGTLRLRGFMELVRALLQKLTTPVLSVIIDAIKESHRFFQRMNSYAIYRIAETPLVLPFMTLEILVFDCHPMMAVMIVMLALLNDGAILSIEPGRFAASKSAGVQTRWPIRSKVI